MSVRRSSPTEFPRPGARAASAACGLAVFASLFGCDPRLDFIARRNPVRDAQVDSGPDACDSSDCLDAAAVDASDDAGCDGSVNGCGVPPDMPGDCSADRCSSLASRAGFCASTQPTSVVVGDTCNAATGHQQFKFAVCTCRGLVTNAEFEVDSLNPTAPSGSASIASNGNIQLGPDTTVDGAIYVSGMYDSGGNTMPRVTSGVIQNPDPPACSSCDPTRFLDVGAVVAARSSDNDNARAQLTPTILNGFSTATTLSLDCGRYYFSRVAGSGPLQIEAKGRVAIFIAGNLALDSLTLTLQNGATAEIYVAGNVQVVGKLELSTSNDGNRVLFAVGGGGTINLGGDAVIDGSIYAPREELVTRGTLELHGSLFVDRANFAKATRVHFAPLPAARETCGR